MDTQPKVEFTYPDEVDGEIVDRVTTGRVIAWGGPALLIRADAPIQKSGPPTRRVVRHEGDVLWCPAEEKVDADHSPTSPR